MGEYPYWLLRRYKIGKLKALNEAVRTAEMREWRERSGRWAGGEKSRVFIYNQKATGNCYYVEVVIMWNHKDSRNGG